MNQFEETWIDDEQERVERDLMRAMRRVDVPPGFADRVMAATATTPPVKQFERKQAKRVWLAGAIAAGLVAGIFLAEQGHLRRQREEKVQRQFEVALRITDRALEHTKAQLARSTSMHGKRRQQEIQGEVND